MCQGDDDEKFKGGQHLARMNLIVKRIENELNELKNLIKLQFDFDGSSSTTANCDVNPETDGNCDTSSIIKDASYYLVDTFKIEDDQVSITTEDPDPDYEYSVNNYNVQELNEDEDQVNSQSQNRYSINEDEIILGGVNFNSQISSKENEVHVENLQNSFLAPNFADIITEKETYDQDKPIIRDLVVESVDLEPADVNSFQIQSPKTYFCSFCSDYFQNYQNLLSHLKIHTVLPFKCKICSKSFHYWEDLKIHIRIHKGEKPYTCSICSYSFQLMKSRNAHMRSHHTGEK